MRGGQTSKQHTRHAQPHAYDTEVPQPDAAQNDEAEHQQIMGHGGGFMQLLKKGHAASMARTVPLAHSFCASFLCLHHAFTGLFFLRLI
jgi:hypothetical protein